MHHTATSHRGYGDYLYDREMSWGTNSSHRWQPDTTENRHPGVNSKGARACTRRVLAPYPEGNVFQKVGEVFEDQINFPAGITFAPRTTFMDRCIFGTGATFGTGCEFRQSCIFGANCAFDSQAKFELPCVYQKNCVFGINCSTAPNSFFEPGCQFIDNQNSIATITPKQFGEKEDVVSKLAAKPKCTICKQRSKSHILIPCGHIAVCKKCSKRDEIKKRGSCPVCRQTVLKIYKVCVD